MFARLKLQSDAGLAHRLDPAYHHPAWDRLLGACRLPLARLGEFIEHITYGPIITGPKAEPLDRGIRVIHQGQVASTGVDPRGARFVAPGSPWDLERVRLLPGDIVFPRSGVAGVGKNRAAVFLGSYDAVVGSFVDLIRLRELDPCYALLCLKTELVWAQIYRIINGVGTPNISFSEISSLQLPMASEHVQRALADEFRQIVHPLHLRWVAGDESAGEQARRRLSQLVQKLDGMVFPNG
ncbi:MAG: hypothetical protein KBI47_01900 [Armatimonadetes bacterium]|jgi:hypothetical protein|nr:hypothetical protein [Armatimonadota bacterium]